MSMMGPKTDPKLMQGTVFNQLGCLPEGAQELDELIEAAMADRGVLRRILEGE